MIRTLKRLGPGFLFAGAAIGVSHLVQSTRAGADFGYGLIWALLLIHLIKYPFFEYGPRYAAGTGKSLLDGYHGMGKGVLIAYILITFATMFTIQTAVTIVTAGIATSLFGAGSTLFWVSMVTFVCFTILLIGRYQVLDKLMKWIVIGLTISTVFAVSLVVDQSSGLSLKQILPTDASGIAFLIAFMGWMPAPLDLSIWQSMWTLEKKKLDPEIDQKTSRFDFNVGYSTTIFLGIGFIALGALVMHKSGGSFSSNGTTFATQLIDMYTSSLGEWSRIIIGIAALTTMFSTTLTTLDASPRVMARGTELLQGRNLPKAYLLWLCILVAGTLAIFFLLISEMGLLIKIATILSFLTAPFYAILNYRLITHPDTPEEIRPGKALKALSIISICMLIGFSSWYLNSLF